MTRNTERFHPLPQPYIKTGGAARRAVTGDEFFHRFPTLHPFLLAELAHATDLLENARVNPKFFNLMTHILYPRTLYPSPHTPYPIPYTLYPIPYTLYPIPYTLYLIPSILYPVPHTLYSLPDTLYPIPYTLYPKLYTLHPILYRV